MKINFDFLKKNKRVAIIAIFLILGTLFFIKPKKVDKEKYVSPTVSDIREEVSGSGSLNASGVTSVYSPTNGIVKNIFVKDGQKVKAGDKLFEVSSSATEQEKALALANLLSAKVSLKNAENDKNSLQTDLESARKDIFDKINTKKIFDENVLAQKPNPSTGRGYTEEEKQSMNSSMETTNKTFKNVEKQYMDADESIRSANASLYEASIAYSATKDSVTKSPFSGTIFNLKKIIGDSVEIATSKQPVLVLANLEQMTIEFQVSEFNVNKLAIGQKVEVKFDALMDQEILGEIVAVDTVGNESLGTVTYGVIIKLLPNEKQVGLIRPSMTANITIVTNEKKSTLTVPRSTLKLNKGVYTLVKLEEGKEKEVEVKVGLIGSDKVEILSGVNEKDNILRIFSLPK